MSEREREKYFSTTLLYVNYDLLYEFNIEQMTALLFLVIFSFHPIRLFLLTTIPWWTVALLVVL